jgi:hypothetical protein
MRTAYSGRAAAFEKAGNLDQAIRDQNMVILLLAVEREILNEQEIADRDKLMLEEAQAYRERGRWLQAVGRLGAAETDRQRAEQLEREARQLAAKAPAKTTGTIEVMNRWPEPVTMIIDGVSYRLAVGETKVITRPIGPFRYELPATKQVSQGQLEAGKTFRLQIQ